MFVATPTHTHHDICYNLLAKRVNVFCEKPLTADPGRSDKLFVLADMSDAYLFVDWVFLFNDHVKYLKHIIDNKKLGNLKSINMNRLNMGPIRHDVNAREDLSSHDISILHYLNGGEMADRAEWINYKRNSHSDTHDSCIGLLWFGNTFVQINTSWHYGKKDRECIFEFEHGFVVWDDVKQTITINGDQVDVKYSSPLQNSINAFLNKDVPLEEMRNITKKIEWEMRDGHSSFR